MATTIETDSLESLRERHESNALRMAIIEQESALKGYSLAKVSDALEAYYDPSNYVNPLDYLPAGYREQSAVYGARPTSITDHEEGRNIPVFQTEQELACIRGLAQFVYDYTETGQGVIGNLANYVIGEGFTTKVTSKRGAEQQLIDEAQSIINDFLTENKWWGGNEGLGRELFARRRVHGERFCSLWHTGNGHVAARVVEPDQVTEPTNRRGLEEWIGCDRPSSWSFGVHSDADDTVSVHGYYVQWNARDTDWDYLPGGPEPITPPGGQNTWLHHGKANVWQNVKRGLSDFFCTKPTLDLARKVLRNTGEGAAIQAAIAFFREHGSGTSKAGLESFLRERSTRTIQRTPNGTRTTHQQQIPPGAIIDHGKETQYKYGPMGQNNAVIYVGVVEALLRSASVRWHMPEHMITGSAANNNYASIFVSESPFVKNCEAMQADEAGGLIEILWQVLRFAHAAGRFGEITWERLRWLLEITCSGPSLVVREPEKEVGRLEKIRNAGWIADETAAAELGYDYSQEQAKGAKRIDPNGVAVGDGVAAPIAASAAVAAGGSGDETTDAVAAAAATQQEIQTSPDLVLNGAQIASAVEIAKSVVRGELPRDAGLGQLRKFFNLSAEDALEVLGSAGLNVPTTPNPRPAGAEESPAMESDLSEEEAQSRWKAWIKKLAPSFWRGYP
jgi:hypothetical protein